MIIAVTSKGKDLDADIDERFGRAAYFLFIDVDTMKFEVFDNLQNMDISQGAGIQAAKTVVDKHAEALITGSCGPKAFLVLDRAGVKVITDVKGRISDAVKRYKNNEFKPANTPNVDGHWV